MNSRQIHRAIRSLFGNYDHKLHNVYIYDWESDFFAISTSGYTVEVEIKISRGDFFADFKKENKHKLLTHHQKPTVCMPVEWGRGYTIVANPETKQFDKCHYTGVEYYSPCKVLPNKFYYACPEGMIAPHEVPKYAGLFYVSENGYNVFEIKKAQFLHKEKQDLTARLLKKYYGKHIGIHNDLSVLCYDLTRHLTEDGKKILNDFVGKYHFE